MMVFGLGGLMFAVAFTVNAVNLPNAKKQEKYEQWYLSNYGNNNIS